MALSYELPGFDRRRAREPVACTKRWSSEAGAISPSHAAMRSPAPRVQVAAQYTVQTAGSAVEGVDGRASSSRAVRGRCRGCAITALVALHEVLIEPNTEELGGGRGDTSSDRRNSAMFLAICTPPLSGLRLMTGRVTGA
jgi:hypothetical protein